MSGVDRKARYDALVALKAKLGRCPTQQEAGFTSKSTWEIWLGDYYPAAVEGGIIDDGSGSRTRKDSKAALLFKQVDLGLTTIPDNKESKGFVYLESQYGFDTLLTAARWASFVKVESAGAAAAKVLQQALDAAVVSSESVTFAGTSYVIRPTFRIKWDSDAGTFKVDTGSDATPA